MKKTQKPEQEHDHDHHIEILKAVAQAWHGHSSGGSKSTATSTSEFDAHRRFFKGRPSRFKIEASNNYRKGKCCGSRNWDFRQSLWDSYEIVSVSKKLETGLVMDDLFSSNGETKRRRESKNSLRSLFNRMSSTRFTAADLASKGGY